MRFDALSLRLGRVALFLIICASSGTAQQVRDPCGDKADARPVLLYDANSRRAKIVTEGYAQNLPWNVFGVRPFPPPHACELKFLFDGRPAEVWVLNRHLKQVFSVTTTAVFALPSGLPELRGLPSAPAAAPPTAAPTPSAKGGLAAPTMLTTDVAVEYLLNEETFDKALQRLRDDSATAVEMQSFLKGPFDQYDATLLTLIGKVQAPATLVGTATSFRNETASVRALFPDTGRGSLAQAEFDFDQLTGEIGRIIADVQRINAKLQSYPVVDVLVNLRSQVDAYEGTLRVLGHEYQNVNDATSVLRDLCEISRPGPPQEDTYLREKIAAEIRLFLTQKYGSGSPPLLDGPTIARIAELYVRNSGLDTKAGTDKLDNRLKGLLRDVNRLYESARVALDLPLPCTTKDGPDTPPATCQPAFDQDPPIKCPPCYAAKSSQLCVEVEGFTDSRTADQRRLNDSTAKLQALREKIVDLNAAEAEMLTAINCVYDNYRASPIVLNVDLQGNSGNLIVYYSIRGTEQFQRYQVTNEVQQPQSACVQALAAGTGTTAGTPNCTTAPSASAAAAAAPAAPGAATSTPAPVTTASATPPPNPPSDFYGTFEVHHFVRGALVTGFAYDSISSRSYSWVACPSSSNVQGACTTPASTATPAPTTYQLVQSNSPQAAVVVGISLFIKREDMFPGKKPPWWQSYLPTEPFLGASVYPLSHYFVGGSLEPLHGFFLTLGPVFGSQTCLPKNWQYAPGQQVTQTSTPTIPSSSHFRKGAFVMAGFDTSLFKAIFGGLWSNVTSVGTPSPTPTASK